MKSCRLAVVSELDEWLGAGDAAFVLRAQARLDDYLSQTGIVVLASHALDLVSRACNKGVWMENGRVLAVGEINDVAYIHSVVGAVAE